MFDIYPLLLNLVPTWTILWCLFTFTLAELCTSSHYSAQTLRSPARVPHSNLNKMGFAMDTIDFDANSPLNKRRKFIPPSALPCIMPSNTNAGFENHMFSSPILPQMSSQAPTPDEIEASLIQVGMRIRKSVSDGYLNSPKKFTPRPFANNLSRLSPETQQALLAGNKNETTELEPYFAGGMHATGGLAVQPLSTATFCGISLAAMSWHTSEESQPDLEQKMWSYSTSAKRGYEADSDSDGSEEWLPQTPTLTPEMGAAMPMDYFNIGWEMDGMSDCSPMTQTGEKVLMKGRRMAKPRSRLMRQQSSGLMGGGMMQVEETPVQFQMPPTSVGNPFDGLQMQDQQDQQMFGGFNPVQQPAAGHRRMLSCGMEAAMGDNCGFAEASFLARKEDAEMDCS